jgi:4-methyl-5(b-hydroxyethyl)-thiazole monophosphate biosynthesis
MSHVITVLANGFEEIEAVSFIDLLRRANITVSVLGLESMEARGAHGITIKAESLLSSDTLLHDGIILPGGQPGTTNLSNSDKVISLVKNAYSQKLLCAAICAAPQVFSKAGILKGAKVSCYPGVEANLQGAAISDLPVSVWENVITSRGVGTAIEFSLAIIKYLKGEKKVESIGQAILAR